MSWVLIELAGWRGRFGGKAFLKLLEPFAAFMFYFATILNLTGFLRAASP